MFSCVFKGISGGPLALVIRSESDATGCWHNGACPPGETFGSVKVGSDLATGFRRCGPSIPLQYVLRPALCRGLNLKTEASY